MKSFEALARAFGKPVEGSPEHAVLADLGPLNETEAELGDRAVAYVLRAEHPTCLASIAPLSAGWRLYVLGYSHEVRERIDARRRALVELVPTRPEVAARYGEVLAAGAGPAAAAGRVDSLAPGGEAVPFVARVLFGELFAGVSPRVRRRARGAEGPPAFDVDATVALAGRLGCSRVDLIDLAYATGAEWSEFGGRHWRATVDVRPLLAGAAREAISAAARMSAAAREALVTDVGRARLAEDPDYLELLLDRSTDAAKGVRRAAANALKGLPAERLEPLAVDRLGTGGAAERAAMVELLAGLATPSAHAALAAHRPGERTARIDAAIDNALAAEAIRDGTDEGEGGYAALGGRRIGIPPPRPLDDAPMPAFGADDVAEVQALIAAENERRAARKGGAGLRRGSKPLGPALADRVVALFGNPAGAIDEDRVAAGGTLWNLVCGYGASWAREAFARLPDRSALTLCVRLHPYLVPDVLAAHRDCSHPAADRLLVFLNGPTGDLRHLERVAIETGVTARLFPRRGSIERPYGPGDLLAVCVSGGYQGYLDTLERLPRDAVWPWIAEHLDVLEQAFGTKATEYPALDRAEAVRAAALLPAVPARLLGPLLEVATGTTQAGREGARALLGDVPEVGPRLLALLDDTRQAVRAGAADWLGRRADAGAAAALGKRLKRERSELVRAAMLDALDRLGEDLSAHVGADALVAEAVEGLKSAKLDKIAWLGLDRPPALAFADGAPVPDEVLRYWLHLAVKLKAPGGNALFEIYLDRLDPASAEALSLWLLDTWIDHDTARPPEAEADAFAATHAPGRLAQNLKWKFGPDTHEAVFAQLRAEYLGGYPNSGAATKGLLGLATRAPAATLGERVRGYLKRHGARTAQASALLELAATRDDPATLQVVIAAATRLRQKGVQAFAGELVERIAERRGWTLEELADRTVPAAGLDDDGALALPCGEAGKAYVGRLDDAMKLVVTNPDGRKVGALPAGDDETTKASRKRLSAAKKEIRQVVPIQTARLYEALCAERVWPTADWLRDVADPPLMRHLARRVVWLGVDGAGEVAGAFRPTAEGDFTDAEDAAVDVTRFAGVRVAHGALVDAAAAEAWAAHMVDYEVRPLLRQFGRPLLGTGDVEGGEKATAVLDRKGWLTDSFTIRGAATRLGYERGRPEDGGVFHDYRKPFAGAGLVAVVDFTGAFVPEENVAAALIDLHFEPAARPGPPVELGRVPPVLLSECRNDLHEIAAKAAFDPEWEKKAGW